MKAINDLAADYTYGDPENPDKKARLVSDYLLSLVTERKFKREVSQAQPAPSLEEFEFGEVSPEEIEVTEEDQEEMFLERVAPKKEKKVEERVAPKKEKKVGVFEPERIEVEHPFSFGEVSPSEIDVYSPKRYGMAEPERVSVTRPREMAFTPEEEAEMLTFRPTAPGTGGRVADPAQEFRMQLRSDTEDFVMDLNTQVMEGVILPEHRQQVKDYAYSQIQKEKLDGAFQGMRTDEVIDSIFDKAERRAAGRR